MRSALCGHRYFGALRQSFFIAIALPSSHCGCMHCRRQCHQLCRQGRQPVPRIPPNLRDPNSSHVGSSSSSSHPAGQQGEQRSGSLFTDQRRSMLGLPANGVAAGAGAAARRGAQADGCTNAGPQCQPAAAGGAGSSRAGRGAAASGSRGAGARPPGLPLLPAGEPLGCQRTGWVSLHQNKCRSAEPASS